MNNTTFSDSGTDVAISAQKKCISIFLTQSSKVTDMLFQPSNNSNFEIAVYVPMGKMSNWLQLYGILKIAYCLLFLET